MSFGTFSSRDTGPTLSGPPRSATRPINDLTREIVELTRDDTLAQLQIKVIAEAPKLPQQLLWPPQHV